MIFMVVVSVLLGAFGWRLQRARRQAEAVAILRTFGDCVEYDYQRKTYPDGTHSYDPSVTSPVPKWLLATIGTDFFHDAVAVHDIGRRPRAAEDVDNFWSAVANLLKLRFLVVDGQWMDRNGLQRLQNSRELRQVMIRGVWITNDDLLAIGSVPSLEGVFCLNCDMVDDQGIAHLDRLLELKSLRLWGSTKVSKVSDDGARRLAERHPMLTELELYGSEITDDAMVWLGKLEELEVLSFNGSKITDVGVARLAELRRLHEMNFWTSGITDASLVHLQNMSQLEQLSLPRSGVRGPGLKHLRQLAKLKYVDLGGTAVTDADLKPLEELPSLVQVDLSETNVTDNGIASFQIPASLTFLSLNGTGITDRSLEALSRHTQLSALDIRQTKVSAAGVAAFQKACPKCEVSH